MILYPFTSIIHIFEAFYMRTWLILQKRILRHFLDTFSTRVDRVSTNTIKVAHRSNLCPNLGYYELISHTAAGATPQNTQLLSMQLLKIGGIHKTCYWYHLLCWSLRSILKMLEASVVSLLLSLVSVSLSR